MRAADETDSEALESDVCWFVSEAEQAETSAARKRAGIIFFMKTPNR